LEVRNAPGDLLSQGLIRDSLEPDKGEEGDPTFALQLLIAHMPVSLITFIERNYCMCCLSSSSLFAADIYGSSSCFKTSFSVILDPKHIVI
jgi:hypothetical protein